jgi:uncharacterized circularly permuted ATP-grasp superfamily protein/uncharacterized alpha-E superfamily protein
MTPGPYLGASAALHYDELRDRTGAIRPHWKPITDRLSALTPAEYAHRRATADGVIRDNGITYNVYDETGGHARPWELDIVPFVFDARDWRVIEAGVAQRATLANAMLRDIYGPQKLIAEGHLPPHLVSGHPQFLRPLMGQSPPGDVHVHVYSADLARAPDGSWIVLSSRADAPSGLGYALENRIVVGQCFSDLFAALNIQRLASFFQTYRNHVQALGGGIQGRTVLLSSGPYNEAYFEHAFLSHYLDLTLVEGDDLVVRDAQVYLKTLDGLERVAVIYRRVDSDFCDPLELRADSALGVPGLAEAVRTNSVVLANALGGSVIESPALDAFLPSLARAVLGEELRIPDTPTVWCGTEWGRREALARLDRVLIRDAFDARPLFSRNSSARLGQDMSKTERDGMIERMTRRGATLVTQDVVPLGLAPVFDRGQIGNRPISLRVFAAWTRDGYVVMPGGLARVASDDGIRALSMQSGAISKDVWIPAEGPVDPLSLLRDSGRSIAIARAGDAPPSRAMDNLFWLGRYAERAENMARVVRAISLRFNDDIRTTMEIAKQLLVLRVGNDHPPLSGQNERVMLGAELYAQICDRRPVWGLQNLLASVLRTAWTVRDRLSRDTWRAIHAFTEGSDLPNASGSFDPAGTIAYLDALVLRAAALSGLSSENMTRGPNRLFVNMGRRIERATHLAWLLRQTLGRADSLEVDWIRIALEIADSSMTYRARYLNAFDAEPLIDLLLLDDGNPRSVLFQLSWIDRHTFMFPRATRGQRRDLPHQMASALYARVANIDLNQIADAGESGKRDALVDLTNEIEASASRISDAITDAYFQHSVRRRTGAARREAE